ncbi:EcsC family protein [Phenylobacterium sp. J367]|uniref:EcsC family protein n=1 Tax=Phenylobacterium sp. J367 TaxID=2898435 RepID=UPI0021516AAB|nr:EcsC family protein [Phenylobacterium sp. J367]MCR5878534.1 EcsC family protein [Phenylobacterium sp. J367]
MPPTPPFAASDAEYEAWARQEAAHWRRRVLKPAGPIDKAARGLQQRINQAIPEKVHTAVTAVIERLTRTILAGSDLTTGAPLEGLSLRERDTRARRAIEGYRNAAAVEGGVTGAGGFFMAMADFPALLTLKIKLLFDLAAIYGKSGEDFAERLFLLHVFQLAFSGAGRRGDVLAAIETWDADPHPESFEAFDWRRFQQEYRDYIDLAKLAQMLPIIGAPVGAVVNWRLTERLGETAMNAYRLRALR